MSKKQCNHLWVSNSGEGGDSIFCRTPFSRSFSMHVKCSKCNTRTWFTKEQWEDLVFTGDTRENTMNSGNKKSYIKIVNLKDAYDYIEKKTGRKIIDSSFENNTLTAYLSSEIKEVNITATLSFKDDINQENT